MPKARQLVQFAYLGSAFAKSVLKIEDPRVALLSVGSESSKGNEVVIEAHQLLQDAGDLNFAGNVESRELMTAGVDVVVCDGFVGNITLKAVEGIATALMGMIKEELTKNPLRAFGGILVKPGLKEMAKKMDYSEYGGAPLLGVNGISIICHGTSRACRKKCCSLCPSSSYERFVGYDEKRAGVSKITGILGKDLTIYDGCLK
ncbi:MAG: hypothetical protein RQM95_09735 [Syntrophaceticus schinkii]